MFILELCNKIHDRLALSKIHVCNMIQPCSTDATNSNVALLVFMKKYSEYNGRNGVLILLLVLEYIICT